MKKIYFVLLLLLPVLPAASGSSRRGAINPSDYPGIGKEEMGQLRWALQIADQDLLDFTNMEAVDQRGMTSYRYCIAFMTYFLAVEQYHKLPACPGIIQPRMERLLEKMIEKPVWEYWAEVSQGLPELEPLMNRPYPESHDPVVDQNIMYSGHLGHMIGLYETLYRDFRWDRPGSIVFAWSDGEKYAYDNQSLQMVMYEQMKNNPWHMIACEPNACFPECNQHPVLSFMLYDYNHGTDLAKVNNAYLDSFLEKKMIDPKSHETAAHYLVKQDITLSQREPRFGNALDLVTVPVAGLHIVELESSSANGWTGTFMHAWQPEYIERHYPYQRDNHVKGAHGESLKRDFFEPRLQYGFFAMLAGEVGDMETRDQLIATADEKYAPVWESGTFHYPFDKDKKCTNLTGKLIAMARANPARGLWAMHNRPFDDAHFVEPAVVEVDFPRVLLRRAVYDREKRALVVTTEPGTGRGETILTIERLDHARSYTLYVDGRETEKYRSASEAAVTVKLDGRHDLVLAENY